MEAADRGLPGRETATVRGMESQRGITMELRMHRSAWSGPASLRALVEQSAAAGFEGIEAPAPGAAAERAALAELVADRGLGLIVEATTGLRPGGLGDWWVPHPEATVGDHLDDLRHTLEHAAEMGASLVTTMCGRDGWPLARSVELFGRAMEAAASAGIGVSFETHRCRSLFHPWVTRDVLEQLPGMRITCDFSHWCVVCERLVLDEEPELLALLASRARHVHARVGDAQHAQVADPSDPANAAAVAAHERWWDAVWAAHEARGKGVTTMTSEWGAEGYMTTLPHTGQPVADLWGITCSFAERQRRRFAGRKDTDDAT